jgi:arsenate reductase-like glutaredoxin family protein
MELNNFFNHCWQEYLKRVPTAKKIFDRLIKMEEVIQNDHIALRTFCYEGMTKEDLASFFEKEGMEIRGHYTFEKKKLKALHLEHKKDPKRPKVFISELLWQELSQDSQKILKPLFVQFDESSKGKKIDELIKGKRPWDVSHEDYLKLKKESEYAAWMAAYGFFPNHFTVSLNDLLHFPTMKSFISWLEESGIPLNEAGGVIKGTPELLLEQASTIADMGTVSFSDGEFEVPTCYYEFAKRYSEKNGDLYHGFITGNADKIFESTHSSQRNDGESS